MLTIPLILLLFITAATLGGEINEGQMLLEVTRVKDKKVLLIGKALAILGMTLLFYVVNVISSRRLLTVIVRFLQLTLTM